MLARFFGVIFSQGKVTLPCLGETEEMAVTVRDILKLNDLNDAEVIAGEAGLDRFVGRIATIEKPFSEHFEYSWRVAQKGDLYMSKLFVFHNDRSKLRDELQFMIESGSSGLVVHRENAGLVDEEMRRYADDNRLPIVSIADRCGFAELTYRITALVVEDKMASIKEDYIHHILHARLDRAGVIETFERINHNFEDNMIVLYVSAPQNIDVSVFWLGETDLAQRFRKGVLFVLTAAERDPEKMTAKVRALVESIKTRVPRYRIGIGEIHDDPGDAREAILESIYANAFCEIFSHDIFPFSKLGIYRLIVRIKDDKALRAFRDEIFEPILAYGRDNHIDLLSILRKYIRHDGNYKRMAEELFIHETTARYRMNKIYEILKAEDKLTFHTNAVVAFMADGILKNDTLRVL